MKSGTKRVGTVLPMTALVSTVAQAGTFAAGKIFIQWLAGTKQKAWQILPLHQTQLEKGSKSKHVPSPYKGYGVGLDPVFLGNNLQSLTPDFLARFEKQNTYWLKTYALFCALRDHLGTDDWSSWPKAISRRDDGAIKEWEQKLKDPIAKHVLVQAQLFGAYQQLRKLAGNFDIALIGDFPFYLGLHSPLVWQYQHLFDLDQNGKPQRVSGVPSGIKSHFGRQVWGHPLYKWQDKTLWGQLDELFRIRIQYLAGLFDWIRFDHAKGLFAYGVIDVVHHSVDKYLNGPGSDFLDELIKFARRHKLHIYAEDTGEKLVALRHCLRAHRIPGIKILRFAYNEKLKIFTKSYLLTDKYPVNTFAYTTTHDTETLVGYLSSLSLGEVAELATKMNIDSTNNIAELATLIRQKVIDSPAKFVLVPLQDWLLTSDRINVPGTEKEVDDTNWQYKMSVAIEKLPRSI
ncbi:MAG: 4-alpha-glucanotransferase [bacterium]